MSEDIQPYPPISIIVVAVILFMFATASIVAHVNASLVSFDLGIHILLVIACMGLWRQRKWAVWSVLALLLAFSGSKVAISPEPIRDFFYVALPPILIVAACTFPHYKRMK